MTRRLAWEILRSGDPFPTRRVGPAARAHGLDARERGFLRRLVAGEVRRRGTLAALVRHFARGRPNSDLAAHLRLGLLQLFFLDQVPDHAAVSETVGAAADTLGRSKAPYVNAVLRAALRARCAGHSGDPRRDLVGRELHLAEPVFRDPREHPLLWAEDALSMPAGILGPWVARFGREKAEELARAALEEPALSIRCAHGEREELRIELAAALDLDPLSGRHEAILLVPARATEVLLESAAFREGRVTVQGEGALRCAELCAAAAGERWLDLCAAPGGKTAVLAAAGPRVLACDVDAGRLERLRATLARLGLAERVRSELVERASAAEPGPFDGVLVDVPCSNSGVLGARPEARWRTGARARASLAELQAGLLHAGAARVRPGGRLVYSTCSLEPEENGRRVRAFLELEAGGGWELDLELELVPEPSDPAAAVDGAYAARLRRR